MRVMWMMLLGAMLWTTSSAGVPTSFLWGEVLLPAGAVDDLATRVQTEGIPLARWVDQELEFFGAEDEEALLSSPAYAFLDGELLLVTVQTESATATLRGRHLQAELVAWTEGDTVALPEGFLELLNRLELLPAECTLELELREIPAKHPAPPEGVRLDSVLWALVNHPDWFGFARQQGLERVGLRVRVVVELQGSLKAEFEPYIQSSSESLAELLIPIFYLPELGADPAARLVRLPHTPYPAEE